MAYIIIVKIKLKTNSSLKRVKCGYETQQDCHAFVSIAQSIHNVVETRYYDNSIYKNQRRVPCLDFYRLSINQRKKLFFTSFFRIVHFLPK